MNEASVELLKENINLEKEKSNILYHGIKRIFDIVLAMISIVLLLPVFIIVAIMIKKDSKGKVIFKQKRIGKNGQPIYIYKFRSMIENADEELNRLMNENNKIKEEYAKNKKLKNDPRITKVGKFIRKTSIDELPQLINILTGDMSFVGPRPYLHKEIIDMGEYYSVITKMTPGLTGLWQVSGRSDLTFINRLKLDNEYYKIRGLKTDIKIIIKTFDAVLGKKGSR